MNNLKRIKRFDVNKTVVMGDVTGAGEWVTGLVTATTKSTVTFQPDDGSEEVTMNRVDLYKPETEAPSQAPKAEPIDGDIVDLSDLEEEEGDSEEDEEEDEEDEGVRIRPNHENYKSFSNAPTVSGRASYDTDDYVAGALRGMTVAQVYETAYKVLKSCEVETIGRGSKKVKVTRANLEARYAHLKNVGMQRMCLGNLIRGTYRQLALDPAEEMEAL